MILTEELIRERVSTLFDRILAQTEEPIEEIVWEIVRCDRCGVEHNLASDGVPIGWTTVGDLDRGFTDLCRGCSG